MKIGNSAENTLVTNVQDTNRSKFKIQATGKAFSILSNALYQHKTRAVVREVGCNAADAHVDANTCDIPFDVTLPTKADPRFTVRDYGIGLSEETFVDVYTTYFGSSKSDSNEHTGGLGLGSKTPFIMSTSFTVHSYYNGIDYMWHSFVNDNGEPDVLMLHSKETTERNGLKVIVPIGQGLSETEQTALFRDFKVEAEFIYKWFAVPPTVKAGTDVVNITPILTGPKTPYSQLRLKGVDGTTIYYCKTQNKVSQSNTINVKMGNVVYPYDLSKVRNLDRFGGNPVQTEAVVRYITNTGRLNPSSNPLVIDVAMGDVDIAPSRESLSLNNTTELAIINALVRFVDMFFEFIQANIDNAKSTYEMYQALYTVPPMTGKVFMINGREVNPAANGPCWTFHSSIDQIGSKVGVRMFNTDRLAIKYRRAGTRGLLPMKNAFSMEMYGPGVKDRTIILADIPYKGELRAWVNANAPDLSAVVVVFGEDMKIGKTGTRPLTAAEMEPFLADGHPQVIQFSKLLHKPAVKAATAGPVVPRVTKEDALLLSTTETSYTYTTAGNSSAVPLDQLIQGYDASKVETTVYIALLKTASSIQGEVADPSNVGKTMMTELMTWSRSQGSSTSWSTGADFLHMSFSRLPSRMDIDKLKVTINGKQHTIPTRKTAKAGIHQILLSAASYNEVVDNPKYPTIYSVDRAFRELILPAMPSTIATVVVSNKESFVGGQGTAAQQRLLFQTLGLQRTIQMHDSIHKNIVDSRIETINSFVGQTRVKEFGYDVLMKGSIGKTHTHSFPLSYLANAAQSAQNSGVEGMEPLMQWMRLIGNNVNEYLSTPGSYSHKANYNQLILSWLKELLHTAGYKSNEFDDFLVQYTTNKCVVS